MPWCTPAPPPTSCACAATAARADRGGRPLPRARGPPPGLSRRHGQPRPRGRARPPAVRRPWPSRWGVEYTPHAQARLVPPRPARASESAPAPRAPPSPPSLLPLADEPRPRRRRPDRPPAGAVTPLERGRRRSSSATPPTRSPASPSTDLAAWPHTPAPAPASSRPSSSPAGRAATACGAPTAASSPVYASHLRVRDTDGEPSTVCLLVRDHERAVLQTPLRVPASDSTTSSDAARPRTPSRSSSAPPPRTTSTASSSAPSNAPATCSTATPPSCSWPPTTRPSWRYAPPPACPPPASASPASPSRRAPAATARRPHARRPRGPHGRPRRGTACSAARGMRSVVTVPLKVEGRLTGSLGVAAEAPAATPARRRCASSSPPTASRWPSSRRPPGRAGAAAPRLAQSFLVEASDLARRHPGPRPDAGPAWPR